MGGKHSRDKGKRFEQKIARELRDMGFDARRGWQAREGDDDPDVIVDLPVWIECKHHRQVNYRAAMRQAIGGAVGTDKIPLVVAKDDGQPEVAILPWADMKDILRVIGGMDAGRSGEGSS